MKVTWNVQWPPFAASATPEHVSLAATTAKSPGFAPVTAGTPRAVDAVCPELVTVNVTAADVCATVVAANVLPGSGVMASAGAVRPVPASVACAVPPGEAAIAKVADSAAAVFGVKTTPSWHVPAGARAAVHVLETTAKSAALVPVMLGAPGTPDATPPVFDSVSVTVDDGVSMVAGPRV